MEIFANRLKKELKNAGMTQKELAKKLGITPTTVGNYIANRREPDLDSLIKIAQIFDCSVDYLLGKTDVRKEELPHIQIPEPEMAMILKKAIDAINKAEKDKLIDEEEKKRIYEKLFTMVKFELYNKMDHN